ncbi:MAG: OsmC family protein [Anaerolineales bacterium]|nr:OsmC family protein [Chloroflexota bacterium]MBL6979902.1 OsmC family protein [Anaerolineales bacterium]
MSADWKEVTAEWKGSTTFIGKNSAGGSVQMGEINGKPGVGPMELLLVGLAGCTGYDVAMILEKKQQPMQDLKINVRGKRVDTYPMVFDQIEIEYLFWGEGLSEKALEQAIELSEEKYCSASAMLAKTAEIKSSYRILSPGEEA